MKKNLKGICAFALTISVLVTAFTACGKKIEYNPNNALADNETKETLSAVIIQNGTVNDEQNASDTVIPDGNNGGSSSGGSYIGGNSSSGGGSSAGTPSGGSSGGNSYVTTKKSTNVTTTTVSAGVKTTRVPTSNPVDQVKVLNSAKLNPMSTNNEKLDAMVDSILAQVAPDSMSTYEKVRSIYNYLVQTNRYGHSVAVDTSGTYTSVYDAEVVSRATNILKQKTGNCMDFSCAFMVLTRKIGLECYYVTGEILNKYNETSYHGWNIIRINGVDYGFDSEGDFRASDSGRKETTYWNFCVDDPVKYKSSYTKIAVARFRSFKTFS